MFVINTKKLKEVEQKVGHQSTAGVRVFPGGSNKGFSLRIETKNPKNGEKLYYEQMFYQSDLERFDYVVNKMIEFVKAKFNETYTIKN